MAKYRCRVCGYIYDEEQGDPDAGLAPGTKFKDIPDGWVCPVCGVSKKDLEPFKIKMAKKDKKLDPYEEVIKKLEEMEEGTPKRTMEFED